jgi:hypothetical protein
LGATIVGKNESHQITHIFEQNANPSSQYMKHTHSNKMKMLDDVSGSFERRAESLASRRKEQSDSQEIKTDIFD